MEITAIITGIEYKICLADELRKIELENLEVNKIPSSCLILDKSRLFALSKWISPKRSRSYPYQYVYNTLTSAKKLQ